MKQIQKSYYFVIVIVLLNPVLAVAQCERLMPGTYIENGGDSVLVKELGNTSVFGLYSKGCQIGYCSRINLDTTNNTLTWTGPYSCSFYEIGIGTYASDFSSFIITEYVYKNSDPTPVNGPTTFCYMRAVTGLKSVKDTLQTKIWPNPATNELHFTINNAEPELNLRVFNLAGACVYSETLASSLSNEEHSINIQNFVGGFYFLQIINGQFSTTSKFIKQ